MAREAQLKDLFTDRFLREIHHLLWLDASGAGASIDGGWNCRDHAWITALLSLTLGHTVTLVAGEAFFSKGATAESPASSFHVNPHHWAWVDGVGAIDLSVKQVSRIESIDFRLPIRCIFASEWIPRRKNNAYFLENRAQFARAMEELPGRRNQSAAVYLACESEYPHTGHLSHAAGWIRSALTSRLHARFGNPSDMYAALFIHLRAFLDERARSLADLSFDDSWAALAADRYGAIDRARRYIEERVDAKAAFQAGKPVGVPA
ncbi:MAG TPA: hypothetical protein VJQ51_05630 [Burkholderiales bacterium]|nr:hypothetical protein [Burkholderiales bacterium]